MLKSIRIIPLGGLGEIGLNMMVIECGEDRLVIDCGLMFPDNAMLGIDVVIPNFSYLLRHPALDAGSKKISAIFITHAHEDHIGALPFLLKELEDVPPIYAPRFAKELILQRLKEYDFQTPKIIVPEEDENISIGSFQIRFVDVIHSVIDSMGLLIKTPVGNIFHSGDFKFDPHWPRPQKKLKQIGRAGVHLLFADSTNVEREGQSLSEKDIKKNFDKIFSKEKGRIFVSAFASNLTRINNLLELAKKHKRKVYLDGRSMLANTEIARRIGFLQNTDVITDVLTDDNNYLFIITGSQAEPYASLTRLAYKSHANLKLGKGDLVILSSRFIPGNERAIHKVMNHICAQGARILYGEISEIHTSGHAHRDELRQLHKMINPRFFIPVHGELRHLTMHAVLASERVDEKCIQVVRNGDVVKLTEDSLKIVDKVPTSHIFVDRLTGTDLEHVILKDRRSLSEAGIVFVVVLRDEKTGEFTEEPYLFSRGFILQEKHSDLFREAKKKVLSHLDKLKENGEIQEDVRIGLQRFFRERNMKSPLVLPIVLDL